MPKTTALTFGSAFHLALEKGLDEGILELQKYGLDSEIPLMEEMVERQLLLFSQKGIEMIDNEIEFEIQLDGIDEKFIGFIDGLAIYNGEPYLVEFKTARSIDIEHVAIDSQITAYLWAAQHIGLSDVKGVLYIVNQKSMNKDPQLLKSGELSTAKNQGCTYESYMSKALEVYGSEIPFKIIQHSNWIKENAKPQVVVIATKRSQEQLDSFEKALYSYVKEEDTLNKSLEEKGIMNVLKETPCFPTKNCYGACDVSKHCKKLLLDDSIDITDMNENKYKEIFEVV